MKKNNLLYKVFLMIIGINLFVIVSQAPSQTINKELLLKGVLYSQSLIKDAQCRYVSQNFFKNDWRTILEMEWAYKPGKSFLKGKAYGYLEGKKELVEDIAYIFNGVNGYSIGYENGKVIGVTMQNRERVEKLFGKVPPEALFLRFWPLGIELQQILSDPALKLLPDRESVEGSSCYVAHLESVTGSLNPQNGYKIWLDPEKGFLPRKIEIYYSGKLKTVLGPITLSNFGNNLWFPTGAKITTFSPDFPQGNIGRVIYEDIRINQNLGDEKFTPVFEPGTKIYDSALGISYTIPAAK
ncbi:MAG TPA: hypothetical protein PKN80_01930 [bacterium]|nr:hypothetical protein [bacterium]HNS48025.1 hypothetical protein [bacterium]